MWEFGISCNNLLATPMWDSGESKLALVGVLTISAPRARNTSTWEIQCSFFFFGNVCIIVCCHPSEGWRHLLRRILDLCLEAHSLKYYRRKAQSIKNGVHLTFSMLIFSGITIIHLYPFTAAAKAKPIPVHKEVSEFSCRMKVLLWPVYTARPIFLSDSDFLSNIGKKWVQHPMRLERELGLE